MALLKCKMCGGDLKVSPEMTVATCQYCGSSMTLPKETDERKANLYNRANHYRLNCEFDKASEVYDGILNEDNTEAEAHWGLVLCKYGIEYVEDPKTHERVPTCHRTLYGSILKDSDYLAALQNADYSAKQLYEKEACRIDTLQKEILALSAHEEPYDVFICYKESDEYGNRTEDSVTAQELYYELTKRGFKVFFARKTLEGKLGSAYEPVIFAALNSARAMVALGTKPENFSAVWVKNEWSRYLAMIKSGKEKTLIPAYRGMSPYDLPMEFSHLQAQDMSKLGFMQDLCDGLEKIVHKPASQAEAGPAGTSAGTPPISAESLLKRAEIARETGDFNSALSYYDKSLEVDPENGRAYWGKFLAKYKCQTEEALASKVEILDIIAGNLAFWNGESYPEFLASEGYVKGIRVEAPTLELDSDYKTACRFASEESRARYAAINERLIKAREKLVADGEAIRQRNREAAAAKKQLFRDGQKRRAPFLIVLGILSLLISLVLTVTSERTSGPLIFILTGIASLSIGIWLIARDKESNKNQIHTLQTLTVYCARLYYFSAILSLILFLFYLMWRFFDFFNSQMTNVAVLGLCSPAFPAIFGIAFLALSKVLSAKYGSTLQTYMKKAQLSMILISTIILAILCLAVVALLIYFSFN